MVTVKWNGIKEVSMGCCTSGLTNMLCFECKEKQWVDQDKKYFCKRFNTNLDRVDGNSGGAVKTMQCVPGSQRSGKSRAKERSG